MPARARNNSRLCLALMLFVVHSEKKRAARQCCHRGVVEEAQTPRVRSHVAGSSWTAVCAGGVVRGNSHVVLSA